MMSWSVQLMRALAVAGYPTVDLRSNPGPQMVSVETLVGATSMARSQGSDTWPLIGQHIVALQALSVDTISMAARKNGFIDIYLGRVPSGSSISIDEVKGYFNSLELWLKRFSELLPDLEPTEAEKFFVAQAKTFAASKGGEVVGSIVELLLKAVLDSSGQGSCVTITPVTSATEAWAKSWTKTDFTSSPTSGISNRQWLWTLNDNSFYKGGRSKMTDNDFRFPLIPPESLKGLVASASAG